MIYINDIDVCCTTDPKTQDFDLCAVSDDIIKVDLDMAIITRTAEEIYTGPTIVTPSLE